MADLPLRKLAEDATSLTLGWDPVAGALGYKFLSAGKTSHTFDAARVKVRVAKGGEPYRVEALGALASGSYPPPPEPPPPPPPVPSAAWPFAVPQPVLPIGLQVVTSGGYLNKDGVEYRGIDFRGGNNPPAIPAGNKRVVFRDCKFERIDIGGEDIWLIGGEIGPSDGGRHSFVSGARRVVLDGVHVHGMHQGVPDDHTEGIQISGVDTLVVRNCRFDDNHVFNLFARYWQGDIGYLLIENNELGPTGFVGSPGGGTYSMRVSGDDPVKPHDIVIRNNRFPRNQPISVDDTVVGAVLENNVPV